MKPESIGQYIIDFLSNPGSSMYKLLEKTDFLLSADSWVKVWFTIRGFFIVLDLILVVAFLGVFIASLKFRPHIKPSHGSLKKTFTLRDAVIKERWFQIVKKAAQGSPDALKISIIDADKLVDDALKQLGLGGEHMADRLEKLSPQEVRSLDKVWWAHRLRNNLVHMPSYQVSLADAKKALENYESFLKEIKILQ